MSKNKGKRIKSRLSNENQINEKEFDNKPTPGSPTLSLTSSLSSSSSSSSLSTTSQPPPPIPLPGQKSLPQQFVEEIEYNEIGFEEVVGKGSSDVVWKGKWRGCDRAIKHFNTEGERTKREEKTSTPTERDEKKDLKTRNANEVGPESQNSKEDTHLISTSHGLETELVIMDKTVMKLTKHFQELQKTNRCLQKEREKLLNDRKNFRPTDYEKGSRPTSVGSDPRLTTTKTPETNDQNSNVYQNDNFSNTNNQKLSGSSHPLYDSLQYSENSDNTAVKRLHDENEILKEELNKINKDFRSLKNKRIHDLDLLNEKNRHEFRFIIMETVKFGNSKKELEGQINTQIASISHLKQKIENLRDYGEEVIVLKAEKEHLENKVKMLNEKVKCLVTPGTEQLQLLQDKITLLQQRHETHEMTLQNLVRDLIRKETQCQDSEDEMGKN
ncbi:hypothetical protein PV326_006093 [Microctonus aethiopoides]|nr:hypothetical protein PV326_006093 [Microctonus aethiopoides]